MAYTTIAAYQFRAGGTLLELVAGIEPATGALMTAAFCVTYTAMAGMLSIAYLDVGNGLMMVVGVVLAVAFLVSDGGGLATPLSSLQPEHVALFGELSPQAALALFFPTLFLLLGEANMYQKFFSAKSERAARLAVVGWIVGTIVVETLIDSVGVFGSVVIPGLSTEGSESIVISVALQILPTGIGVLLVCGAAAIIVSTANSFLLTPATNLMRDVYQRFVNPKVADQQLLVYIRLVVVALGFVGYVIGSFFPSILAMALWAYTMYGAGITPALLGALVWPRIPRSAGVWSILAGMPTPLVWEIIGLRHSVDGVPEYPLGLETVYPALTLSILALVVVGLTARPSTTDFPVPS